MAKKVKFDFCGYATKNDLLCSDGRTIRRNAFASCDGKTVPLVWNHGGRSDPSEVLGHALLENRNDGVYMYGTFNNSEKAGIAKELVKHGDITGLSIYANSLKQKQGDVLHGVIREVSLVLSGANPGATIDFVMQHDSESLDGFFYYLNGDECELSHSDDDNDDSEETEQDEDTKENDMQNEYDDEMEHADGEKSLEEILDTLNDEQKAAVVALLEAAEEDAKDKKASETEPVKHSDDSAKKDTKKDDTAASDDEEDSGEDVDKILDTLSDKQKAAVAMLIDAVVADEKANNKKDEDEENMKHNAFESDAHTPVQRGDIVGLMDAAIGDLKRYGSLKDSVLAHADEYGYTAEDINKGYHLEHAYPRNEANQEITYGVSDIEYLFPEARTLQTQPAFIKRNDDWVTVFMNAAHTTPFARVKSLFANITAEEARAKGYTKGNLKEEEVFALLKRVTDPQTIYKKQKLDRDDILDITDFSVVAWMKEELRIMLNEECARACLIGDGRSNVSPDKISELHIRPIYTDDNLFSIKSTVTVPSDHTEDDDAKAFIKAAIKARKNYKGAGSPILFTTSDMLTSMLLLEDGIGRSLYATEAELAAKLRVSKIAEVPVMENITRTSGNKTLTLAGIIVNPIDYNIGTNNGAKLAFFDDFDIDYNQEKYLLETRMSGALVNPYSAIVLELDPSGEAAHTNG